MNEIKVVDLLLIGGGHAHVHVIKMLGMNPIIGLQVTLISRDVESPYSGMIPGFVAGYYTKDECHIDLRKLCSFSNVKFINAEVCKLDTGDQCVECTDERPSIRYDYLSINIGISPSLLFSQNTRLNNSFLTPVKPIDGFAIAWNTLLNKIIDYSEQKTLTIAIVGGGAGGVELAFSIHHRICKEFELLSKDVNKVKVILLTRGHELLNSHCK
jgi:selenide,water dikinase